MERFGNKPTMSEIFDALTSEETTPDWDAQILREADRNYLGRIRGILDIGLPLGEARILLRSLED